MPNLILELRQGEMMILNGAPIRFRSKTRVELTARARFLFGKQIMSPRDADTPARRLYLALQQVYIGTPEERERGIRRAKTLGEALKDVTTSAIGIEIIDRALAAATADQCYLALKLIRRMIRHEDAVLGRVQAGFAKIPHTTEPLT
jgi:flagellar protein FlbT